MRNTLLFIFLALCSACNSQENQTSSANNSTNQEQPQAIFNWNTKGNTIQNRFEVSGSMSRIQLKNNSFGDYLRNLPLKANGEKVLLHTGEEKWNQDPAAAVIDLPIGKRDLHQCADGVMHLKARYHYEKQEYDQIGFHFVNGFYCDYNHWKNGYRVRVNGNKTNWYKSSTPDSSAQNFWKYLEMVFAYAGTLSLAKELKPISIQNIQIGDVFIVGGSPGHAVIVVDLAEDKSTNQKYFLLAQSYMPAQELHVLHNYKNEDISPWYSLDQITDGVSTPEWNFDLDDLKRF